ncbi:MAG: efflux RND transporter periplasmic adaptor subunit, partial [Ilumatobacteraceae bacterium]
DGGADGGTPTGASTGGPNGGGSSTGTNTPTSEDLIAYQFAVDAAQFGVDAAQQALAQAVIVSPIAGTVTAIDLHVGDEVTAASTTQTIVIEGPDGYEATTTVSINDIADIHLTQQATVVPDGSTETISGEVVAIAPTPDPASSTTSYRVTIGFDDDAAAGSDALRNGNIGDVSIVTGVAADAVAVPTSAVELEGTQQMVTIIDADGVATTTPVSVGLIGDEWTEILSGVAVGDVVVLADLGEPLPGSATDVASNTGTGEFAVGGATTRLAAGGPTFSVGPGG